MHYLPYTSKCGVFTALQAVRALLYAPGRWYLREMAPGPQVSLNFCADALKSGLRCTLSRQDLSSGFIRRERQFLGKWAQFGPLGFICTGI